MPFISMKIAWVRSHLIKERSLWLVKSPQDCSRLEENIKAKSASEAFIKIQGG